MENIVEEDKQKQYRYFFAEGCLEWLQNCLKSFLYIGIPVHGGDKCGKSLESLIGTDKIRALLERMDSAAEELCTILREWDGLYNVHHGAYICKKTARQVSRRTATILIDIRTVPSEMRTGAATAGICICKPAFRLG